MGIVCIKASTVSMLLLLSSILSCSSCAATKSGETEDREIEVLQSSDRQQEPLSGLFKILFDKTSASRRSGNEPAYSLQLFHTFSFYFYDILGPLGRDVGSNPCPLMETLENITSGLMPVAKELDTFDFIKEELIKAAKAGLFNEIEMSSGPSQGSQDQHRWSRQIAAHLQVSWLDRDRVCSDKDPCPFGLSWPMQWTLRSTSNANETLILDINALPVRHSGNSSYKTLPDSNRPPWNMLQDTNSLFFRNNKFVSRSKVQRSKQDQRMKYFYDVSDDIYQCTKNFIEQNCSRIPADSELNLCDDWGRVCKLDIIADIQRNSETPLNFTHVVYLPRRQFARQNPADEKKVFWQSLDGFPRNSMMTAMERVTLWRELGHFVPEVPQKQDSLTYLLLLLTCFSEWIFSNPIWSFQIWRRFILRGSALNANGFIPEPTKVERQRRRLRMQYLLLIPAVITYIPLAIGYALSQRRDVAKGGLLSAGYAFNPYRAIGGVDPVLMGRTFGKSLVFVEDMYFENLKREYLSALCLITPLILYSAAVLALETWNVLKLRASLAKLSATKADKLNSQNDNNVNESAASSSILNLFSPS